MVADFESKWTIGDFHSMLDPALVSKYFFAYIVSPEFPDCPGKFGCWSIAFQLLPGGAVLSSKSAIHSIKLEACFAQCVATNIGT
jgi:hypothetical protein